VGRRITIEKAFDADYVVDDESGVTFVLSGFVNPATSAQSDSFEITTLTLDGYYIDSVSDGLVLNSDCNYPCKSCGTEDASTCTACFTSGTLDLLQSGTCVSSCATGFFDNADGDCEACSANCLDCEDTSSTCTECGIGNFLFLHEEQCLSACPSGYFNDEALNECVACEDNCDTCSLTANTCTSCSSETGFPFLHNDECLADCEDNGLAVEVDGACVDCLDSCKTCSGAVDSCTSCDSHKRYDSGLNTCTEVCQEGIQIYVEYSDGSSACEYCEGDC
jgi:proprotein convertase subtilisin/kexin type 5